MPFAPELDFAQITDGLQAVTFRRADTLVETSVASVLRRIIHTLEAAPAGGAVTSADVNWHVPHTSLATPPRLGDYIIDSAGTRWTILAIDELPLVARWRCHTRNLALAAGLCELIAIEQAEWSAAPTGPIATWEPFQSNILARIQPVSAAAAAPHENRPDRATHRVYLADVTGLTDQMRVIDSDDRVYYILSIQHAPRIDALPFLYVLRS